MFDCERWLNPFDGENPSGQSLRHENEFATLVALATPKFKIVEDENNNPIDRKAEPINWGDVLSLAEDLSTIGRDIRLLTIVTRGLTGENGLSGAIEGVELLTSSLDQYWDSIHPQIRAGGNATGRLGAIRELENDEAGLWGDLQRMEVINERGIGSVALSHLAQASLSDAQVIAKAPSGLSDAEQVKLIEHHHSVLKRSKIACRSMANKNPEAFEELAANVSALEKALTDLENKVQEKLEGANLKFSEFKSNLSQISKTLNGTERTQEPEEKESTTTVTNVTEGKENTSTSIVGSEGGHTIPAKLNSRDEVQTCLQLIIDFYERTEPSSPIPLLATRMKKMVPMDFLELMSELAPAGLKEFNNIAGTSDKK